MADTTPLPDVQVNTGENEKEIETFLNDTWCLYFHEENNDDWSEASYVLVYKLTTVEEFVDVHRCLEDSWSKGMFFLTREHIKPMWEDPHNRDGGCFSFKIMKNEVATHWFELASKVLGETITQEKERSDTWGKVCGVSISPKRSFCILRVWIGDHTFSDPKHYNILLPNYTKLMFRPYNENKDFQESC